ncbi:hypothetical protein EVAR_68027_1 [Eumeta japonica]|uniref:Integrase zinc-binding domain-containing protein n=1 Tax=Eumeta variegata TaxID=151549 RepID=A0A4C1SX98_EUMVA|nr:hypothetical protein EVAR_68027_1 [Eumeta japonica]
MRAAAVGAATPRKQSTGAGHGRDHAVRLLVEHYHRRAGHANHEAVVNIIRERFWITRLRPTVKKVANACRLCRVRRAQPVTPKMADLPEGLAFVKGHLRTQGGLLRATGGDRRATSREEVGGVIHVSDDARCPYGGCVLAIRRLHDNGAAKIYGKTRRANVRRGRRLGRYDGCAYPTRPGGSWERLVRSIKVALSATAAYQSSERRSTTHTLLLEAEFVVNSRPLTHISVLPR